MSVTVDTKRRPAPIHIDRQGISFWQEPEGVGIEVEYEDDERFTRERYVVLSRPDWDAVVAHVSHYGAPQDQARRDDGGTA